MPVNVAVHVAFGLCDVRAMPAVNEDPSERVCPDPASGVQVVPSGEVYAVYVPPARPIRSHTGTVPVNLSCVVPPPATDRHWTTTPFPGVAKTP